MACPGSQRNRRSTTDGKTEGGFVGNLTSDQGPYCLTSFKILVLLTAFILFILLYKKTLKFILRH